MKTIGCVGSRNLNGEQLNTCYAIGYELGKNGYKISSGNADGADYTFAKAVSKHDPSLVTLYVPSANHRAHAVYKGNKVVDINDDPKYQVYLEIAATCHPYWKNINKTFTKNLFARNAAIVSASDTIIAFPNETKWSGTHHTLKVAEYLNKPTFTLSNEIVTIKSKGRTATMSVDEFISEINKNVGI